ncbi:MAG: N-acetyl-gamma-glutamyl-phosphate reductase [Lachnospiraceae bacterium]|nr:N-acetyl-gamma-glutamyl-phosphate reductase [Lachnospiraceae bacterium]
MKSVFIDGSAGTTGLRICERLEKRDDLKLIILDDEHRKDPAYVKDAIFRSDITFLCLPDAAAVEAVELAKGSDTVIIDTSTAHRINDDWTYGFPELDAGQRAKIAASHRIANPGCYATGFISIAAPLVQKGVIDPDFPISAFAVSGYSGAGKKAIAVYEGSDKPADFNAPREYALSQMHKHIPEMQKLSGLKRKPLFSPIVDDYYSGMFVSIPFYTDMLNNVKGPDDVRSIFEEHYKGERFIKVRAKDAEAESDGFISANVLAGRDVLELFVTGNEERIVVTTRFDNLGKGASGAAIQNMNIVLGVDEACGLEM